MKKLLTITLLLFITTIANSQIIRAELTATGLTCSMCSKATYNQLAENNTSFVIDNNTYTFMETKSSTLNGEVKLKIMDKGYVVDKEFKKLSNMTKQYPSYVGTNKNTYHIKTL